MSSKTNYDALTAQRATFAHDNSDVPAFEGWDAGLRWNGWAIPLVAAGQVRAAVRAMSAAVEHPFSVERQGSGYVIRSSDPADRAEYGDEPFAILSPEIVSTDAGKRTLYRLDLGWAFRGVATVARCTFQEGADPGGATFGGYLDRNRRGAGGWPVPLVTEPQMRAFVRAFNAANPQTQISWDARTATLSGPSRLWGADADDDAQGSVELEHELIVAQGSVTRAYALDCGWIFDLQK